jgi:hypothetical protein
MPPNCEVVVKSKPTICVHAPVSQKIDFKTSAIQFHGCENNAMRVSAAEKRLASVTSQLNMSSGLTPRECKALTREAKILQRWLFPNMTPTTRRRGPNRAKNQRRVISTNQRGRNPTKRAARAARRSFREQNTLEIRPDYVQPVVCTEDERHRLIQRRKQILRKQAWYKRKHALAS